MVLLHNPRLGELPTTIPRTVSHIYWGTCADQGNNLTIVATHDRITIPIPFTKREVPAIPLGIPIEGLIIGNDLGLDQHDFISVMHTPSVYREVNDNPGRVKIRREILERKELAYDAIKDLKAMWKKFHLETGTFENIRTDPHGTYLRHKRNGNWIKQKNCNT